MKQSVRNRTLLQTLPFILQLHHVACGNPIDSSTGVLTTRNLSDDATSPTASSRFLALGDFDNFNELFKEAKVNLGTHELGSGAASLAIEDLFCSSITVGDIQTSHQVFPSLVTGQDVLQYTAIVRPFSIECQAKYTYRLLGFPGGGTVRASAQNNELETRVHLLSPSTFRQEPPITSQIDYCLGQINTNGNVEFEGDFISDVLNVFRDPVSDLIDQLAARGTCHYAPLRHV